MCVSVSLLYVCSAIHLLHTNYTTPSLTTHNLSIYFYLYLSTLLLQPLSLSLPVSPCLSLSLSVSLCLSLPLSASALVSACLSILPPHDPPAQYMAMAIRIMISTNSKRTKDLELLLPARGGERDVERRHRENA